MSKLVDTENLFSLTYSRLIRKYAIRVILRMGWYRFFNEKVKRELNRNIESNSSVVLQVLNLDLNKRLWMWSIGNGFMGDRNGLSGKKWNWWSTLCRFFVCPYPHGKCNWGLSLQLSERLSHCIYFIKLFNIKEVTLGWPSLISILMIGFGITQYIVGVIAEYLWRTLDAARGRPSFIIESVEGLSQANQND